MQINQKPASLLRTVTVGFGISPNQLDARGLYRRYGISPIPEVFFFMPHSILFVLAIDT